MKGIHTPVLSIFVSANELVKSQIATVDLHSILELISRMAYAHSLGVLSLVNFHTQEFIHLSVLTLKLINQRTTRFDHRNLPWGWTFEYVSGTC